MAIGSEQLLQFFVVFVFILIFLIPEIIGFFLPARGYYRYEGDYYYYQGISWYQYEDYEGWCKISPPKELKKKHKRYYISSNYSSTYYHSDYKQYPYSIDRFEDSRYYREPSSSSSGSDDDYSWSSSDSWDSSSTDWDSDW